MLKRKIISIVFLTMAVLVFLSVFVGNTIEYVNKSVTQNCFDDLVAESKHLADDLCSNANMDHITLSTMAKLIDISGGNDDDICTVMRTYNSNSSYISYVELLRADNTMLDSDGTVRDVSGAFDFALEAKKGAYISGISQSTLDAKEMVVRTAIPIERNGKTVSMLYGVIRLSELAQKYKTSIYDGHAFVYVVDGDTGDFLLDTWHKSLGNINEFGERKTLPGYDFGIANNDLKNGKPGDMAFVSKTTGGVLYMHFEPVGINNWSVMVTVQKEYALRDSEAVSSKLYTMAATIGIVGLLYMLSVLSLLFAAYRRVHKMGLEDKTTGLANRNAYDAFFAQSKDKCFDLISCVYIDANGLHEVNNKFGHQVGDQMLRIIADALKSEFSDKEVYRIGGDEFVALCEGKDESECIQKMQNVRDSIELHDYHISYGVVCRRGEVGVNRITQEADEKMLEDKKRYYAESGTRRHS